jgi:hypothetical protein
MKNYAVIGRVDAHRELWMTVCVEENLKAAERAAIKACSGTMVETRVYLCPPDPWWASMLTVNPMPCVTVRRENPFDIRKVVCRASP